jgi:rod shape-determining protein MreC
MRVRQTIIFGLVGSLLLFGADRAGVLAFPRQVVGGVLMPVQLGWYRFSQAISEKLDITSRIGTLSQENLDLRAENDNLKAEIAKLESVRQENQALLAQIGTPESKDLKLLMAVPLGFVPTIGEKEMILSVGSSSGVAIDQAVISGNVVLGRVSQISAERSNLRLVTDPQSQVIVVTNKGARGILTGQFQATAKMTKVLLEESLSVGDIVLTSGEGGWPTRFVIGEITKVTKRDNELFQEAEVRPLVNFEKLQLVSIILGSK